MVLVTGGTGLVGANLLLQLVRNGESVRATHRKSSNFRAIKKLFDKNDLSNQYKTIDWLEVDVLDVVGLEKAFEGITYVYHCAAIVSFSPADIDLLYQINIEGTANVVNISLKQGVKKLCYVSSTAAIGKTKDGTLSTEKTPWNSDNASHYAKSKYRAELEVWRGKEEGLSVVIVNPSIIMGENEWGKSSTNIITSVWKGLSFYTSGGNAFVDVKDVVKAMMGLQKSDITGERFLVTSENWSFEQLFTTIAQQLNKKKPTISAGKSILGLAWRSEKLRAKLFNTTPVITKETARTAQTVQQFSNQKLRQALSFQFIPLTETIENTCKAFLEEQNIKII